MKPHQQFSRVVSRYTVDDVQVTQRTERGWNDVGEPTEETVEFQIQMSEPVRYIDYNQGQDADYSSRKFVAYLKFGEKERITEEGYDINQGDTIETGGRMFQVHEVDKMALDVWRLDLQELTDGTTKAP